MPITPFVEDDRAVLVALWQATGLTRPWNDPDADIDRALQNPSSDILVARHDGQIIGSVMYGYDGHRGWIYYLATTESQRGTGLGRRLTRAAEDRLRDMGCPKVELMVRDTNTDVLGFYEHNGYERQPVAVMARWLIEPAVKPK